MSIWKKNSVLICIGIVVTILLGACAAPTPEEMVVTQVVKETVIVEGTPQIKEVEVVVTATPEPAGGPKRGGILRHALPPVAQFDPAFLTSVSDDEVSRPWHDFFVHLDEDNLPDFERSLATGYEVNEEATVWTLALRQGVQFHNGKNLTAEDIVFTYNRLRDPEVGAPTVGTYANITDIEALDDYTIRFTLENPNPDFLFDLGEYHAVVVDSDTTDFETEWNGTGPFIIESYAPEDRVVFKRNPNYWMIGEDGEPLPYLDGMEYIFLTEPSAQVEALRGGQVHWVNKLLPEFVEPLESDPDIVVPMKPSNFSYVIGMRSDRGPTSDNRVRQAIKLATDRSAILEAVALGLGVTGRDTPIGLAYGDYYLDVPEPERDVEKAKALLAEAGYPDGLEIVLTTLDQHSVKAIAVVLKEQLAEAGITVNIEIVPSDVFYGTDLWLEADFSIVNWGGRPYPLLYLSLAYECGAIWSSTHWCDEELDELAQTVASELDHAKRVELYHQIQEIFMERGTIIVPFFQSNLFAHSASVKGFVPAVFDTSMDFRKVWLEE